MKIGVIGLGYVGLTTALSLAKLGFKVYGNDKDKEKMEKLKNGICPIYEPGLDELLVEMKEKGNIEFIDNISETIRISDVIFICVGTPTNEDGSPDLSQVEEVSRIIAENLNGYKLIVEKSTVPVQTAQWIKRTIKLYSHENAHFDVASNPEFLREGSALYDTFNPDRIVIGVESERAKEILLKIYEKINAPKLIVDVNTAEIIKHASNAFLAMKISFINMVSDLCEKTGADIKKVAEGIGYDRRIGREFLSAGVGYGGYCLPKDIRAFYYIGKIHNLDFSLLELVERINNSRIDRLMEKLKKALWHLKNKKIAIWGLSFKPNTDDIREAPSIKIVKRLINEEAIISAYDPKAMENFKKIFQNIQYGKDKYEVLKDAHALVILTEWDEFKSIDIQTIKKLMRTYIIVDGRNIFDCEIFRGQNIEYYPIGRTCI
ncbi:MAG: UDP-glucose/GDP-mannose dehydrogenase family protein [candidate division WOR-3 bacterium]|nr:UDP-glucose/GDP-mannose dehydrogenase family protein [candidate division WOR-3 bacterium]MCX7947723.1 UDP-glucose/GDP-mannose dehydrogenase family protein [candidate division WOR-3 bacterium]MDW8150354.1 UDP-glucose/GDP-mannose dehydrogenase family protein [candidate division WOR-3 bacterium]